MKKLEKHPEDQMTPIERAEAIRKGESFDRMPVNLFIPDIKSKLIDCKVKDLYFDVDKIVEAEFRAYDDYGMDWLFTGPNSRGIAESLGAEVKYLDDDLPKIASYVLGDYGQMKGIEMNFSDNHPRIRLYHKVVESLSDGGAGIVNIGTSVGGPLTIASYLRGTETLLRDMRRNPEQLKQLLELIVQTQKRIVDAYKNIPGITFALADPVASGSLLPPKYFRAFAYPYLQEIVNYINHSAGHKPSLHMCGNVERIWPEIKSLDLSTFSIDNASDIKQAVDYFSDKFTITGNVAPVEVMYKGSKQEVYQAVQNCVERVYGDPSKATLGLGCDMPLRAPLDNIQHYMDAVRYYASYEQVVRLYR
ncbi:uroporphyrinogen decarboxylase family protein [Facklamia sp. DSM 111018]|uniref:Uroporphyrinogen decarboxylase family protein n=1 Tax=Facklamia lactis TaxID=2749967 RepID=A0ABS0LPF4_9LACT|nr:uroporphyrinogen decarboxylase family protein [Facklamia lactis]MBG9980228.1 uroporphyrinogen decarboxylase family protein [Facklamia lactis]MBG9986031.1 uroporphyrinogen decarboxylase family protein [Facklamia lactis]